MLPCGKIGSSIQTDTPYSRRVGHTKIQRVSVTGDNGDRYGALSYLLFKALSECGLERQLKDVHCYILYKFREVHQLQNPAVHGNKSQPLFDQMDYNHIVRSTSIFDHKGSFRLLAGHAHSIRIGI